MTNPECGSTIARRYGYATCDNRPGHTNMHCQSDTGITWTDEQARLMNEDDSC